MILFPYSQNTNFTVSICGKFAAFFFRRIWHLSYRVEATRVVPKGSILPQMIFFARMRTTGTRNRQMVATPKLHSVPLLPALPRYILLLFFFLVGFSFVFSGEGVLIWLGFYRQGWFWKRERLNNVKMLRFVTFFLKIWLTVWSIVDFKIAKIRTFYLDLGCRYEKMYRLVSKIIFNLKEDLSV